MANIILLMGTPASGKSSYLSHVHKDLGLTIPVFAKDDIKEIMFDIQGIGNLEQSKRQGAAAWDILMLLVSQLSRSEGFYIVEGNFNQRHRDLFEKLEKEQNVAFDQILFCLLYTSPSPRDA